ncbi:hypothetical protein BJ166DRAFT_611157 [Pestalotiopsis sp. NC0098]|nr:hypothetical protein BJ166DRAFT_611157 [Pestalotiopsis sp. NC0098]
MDLGLNFLQKHQPGRRTRHYHKKDLLAFKSFEIYGWVEKNLVFELFIVQVRVTWSRGSHNNSKSNHNKPKMPLPSVETQVKVASEGKPHRSSSTTQGLSQFYTSTSARLTGAGVVPDISVNGHVCSATSPAGPVAELRELLDKQGAPVHFDVHSVDAHPVNPHYVLGSVDPDVQSDKGDKLSLSLQVSGTVRFGKGDTAVVRGFNDAFVLVPHWEAQGRNAPRGLRGWLAVSQNLRYL